MKRQSNTKQHIYLGLLLELYIGVAKLLQLPQFSLSAVGSTTNFLPTRFLLRVYRLAPFFKDFCSVIGLERLSLTTPLFSSPIAVPSTGYTGTTLDSLYADTG